jgi:polysaccharide export outer membrane protein
MNTKKPADPPDLPRELNKATLPDYVIEPPDILLINAVRVIPKPPYHIEPGDALLMQYSGETFPGKPLGGVYVVEPEGIINLGPDYGGTVEVVDLTLKKAEEVIAKRLQLIIKPPPGKAGVVSVSLAQSGGRQQIRGEHLVRPDGTVGLGTYGKVRVTGLTLEEAKEAIEEKLSKYLLKPEVTVDVAGYNSKVVYVIFNQAAGAEQVLRLPVYGNETVLDAISQVSGLPVNVSRKRIWVARPAPAGKGGCDQILPIDWQAVSKAASTATNYQILPGDRIYIAPDPLIRFDTALAKILSPAERVLGITLLGATTVRTVRSVGAPVKNVGGSFNVIR